MEWVFCMFWKVRKTARLTKTREWGTFWNCRTLLGEKPTERILLKSKPTVQLQAVIIIRQKRLRLKCLLFGPKFVISRDNHWVVNKRTLSDRQISCMVILWVYGVGLARSERKSLLQPFISETATAQPLQRSFTKWCSRNYPFPFLLSF